MAFGSIKAESKARATKLERIDSPIFVDNSNVIANYDFVPYLIMDEAYTESQVKSLCKYIESKGMTRYIIMCALEYKIKKDKIKEDQKEGLITFYRNNQSDFYKLIPPGAPVITFGPALYAVTMEDDVYPVHVQQAIFGRSNLWYSRTLDAKGNYIYPVESLDTLFNGYGKWGRPIDSYMTKLFDLQLRSVLKTGNRTKRYPKLVKNFITSEEEFNTIFYEPNKDRRGDLLAWDLETSGLDFNTNTIGCITLSFDGVTGYYIPWRYVAKDKLDEILKNNIQVMANGKFDIVHLWKAGLPHARVDEDVIQLGHTLDETRSNTLKALAFLYTEYGGYERPLDLYKEGHKIESYLEIPEEILKEYAIMDAIVTLRVYKAIIDHVRTLDEQYPNEFYPGNTMEHYYRTYRIPAVNMYAKIEYNGVYVNIDKLNAARQMLFDAKADIESQIRSAFKLSESFKLGSDTEIGKMLESKGWEDLGRAKGGHYLVGKEQLALWKKFGHSEAKLLQELASIDTLLGTFTGYGYKNNKEDCGWAECLTYHPEDESHRMHPSFLSMQTDSGRSRCKHPNMQQVPTRGKFAGAIKKSICTPNDDEFLLCTVDYASLQLRLCCMDEDERDTMYDAFQDLDVDIHSQTGWGTFCQGKLQEIETITVEQDGKTFTFLGGQVVNTVNRGEVFAKDLTEEDTLVV